MAQKTITAILLATAILGVCIGSALAQEIKLGYIDSQRIFAEYGEVDAWKAQAAAMEQELVRLQDELRAQSLMLSEEKQKEKKLVYDKKLEDYQRFMADTFGENGLAARRNAELTQPIVEKINSILEVMAEREGFTLVFDVANANIVYANKQFDLTDQVLVELNKQQ
jgi:outer membrane protein